MIVWTSQEDLDDYGIEWQRPVNLTVDSVEVDHESGSYLVRLHLWDLDNHATEWDGQLCIKIADDDNLIVFSSTMNLMADDFTTVRAGDMVDTYYVLAIPFADMTHVSDAMIRNPVGTFSFWATYAFEGKTLLTEVRWWAPPVELEVSYASVDEDFEEVDLHIILLDVDGVTTKWAGDLRLVITDSTGFEMFNASEAVEASDFNLFTFGHWGYAWYITWVDFDNLSLSSDRIEGDPEDPTGRWMRFDVEFRTTDGAGGGEDGLLRATWLNTTRIPDALLYENLPPEPVLETDRFGLAGREMVFDASGTRDDLGTNDLRYEWSWGDGTPIEVTGLPYTNHTFDRAGTYEVELRVVDIEGANASIQVTVDIMRDPRVDLEDDREPPRPLEWLRSSYIMSRLSEGRDPR
jgi:hypothetical protein